MFSFAIGGIGAGMMQDGMTPTQGGMAAIFASRVTPMMSLPIDDVRGYLGGTARSA